MHVKHSENVAAEATVQVKFILEDPASLGCKEREVRFMAHKGETLLEAALDNGVNIEHSCGGVCACSTCHVYINEGGNALSKPKEDEEDRVEEAAGLRHNSRLSCQCRITGDGPIVVQVPAWNRNAVKEIPH